MGRDMDIGIPVEKTLKDVVQAINEAADFSGAVYENQNTATADTARRFETSAKKLRDVVLQVATYAQLFGDSNNQRYSVQVGETLGFTSIDISTLWFKNASAGQNGTVRILGMEE